MKIKFMVLFVRHYGFMCPIIVKDKRLTYSSLGENNIYNTNKNADFLKMLVCINPEINFALIPFEGFNDSLVKELEKIPNVEIIGSDKVYSEIKKVHNADKIILAAKIGKTPKSSYEQIKNICIDSNKIIYKEVV